MMRRILIAVDKFKGTMTAGEAAAVIADCLRQYLPDVELTIRPIADGGEGTAVFVTDAASRERRTLDVYDFAGRAVQAEYYVDRGVAVMDSSAVVGSGMWRGREPNPMIASSFALGHAVRRLVGRYDSVIVGLGGTATVDGGAGLLQALGAVFYDEDGNVIDEPMTAESLGRVGQISLAELMELRGRLRVVSDVSGSLVPENGGCLSSLDFARQKGVDAGRLPELEVALRHYQSLLPVSCRSEYDAAAGGLGFALCGVCGVGVQDTDMFFEKLFDRQYDLVITGEGCFDRQSLSGKGPWRICGLARSHGCRALIVCGCCGIVTEVPVIDSSRYRRGVLTPETARQALFTSIKNNISLIDSLLGECC